MRKTLTICILWICLLAALPLRGQIPDCYTHTVDSLALYIGCQCKTEEAKLEMLYRWMTAEMTYNPYPVLEQEHESDEAEASRTLRMRSGVCRHFAKLFGVVGCRMQIPVYVVEGYVKSRDGRLMTALHAWCVARVGERWYVYDPTWGMGNVSGQEVGYAPSMDYCRMTPETAIRTHMPCDPMWQLLERPVTYEAFDSGRMDSAQGKTFNYNDSLRIYLQQTKAEQLASTNRRMRANGRANSLTEYYKQVNERNITVYRNRAISDLFREALRLNNRAIDILSELDCYRRHNCQPKRTPSALRRQITEALSSNHEAVLIMETVTVPDTSLYAKPISNLRTNIEDVAQKLILLDKLLLNN